MRLKNGEVCFGWPLAQHVITAGWKYNSGALHRAIDLRALVGTPVFAAEDGTVRVVYHWNGRVTQGDTNSYGNMVKIEHTAYKGGKLETLYDGEGWTEGENRRSDWLQRPDRQLFWCPFAF